MIRDILRPELDAVRRTYADETRTAVRLNEPRGRPATERESRVA